MNSLRLAWMLRKAGDARSSLTGVLAYALVTALLLVTISGAWVFLSWRDETASTYQMLAALALVLLVVPLAYLGAAAARLSARTHNRRLSTLRLVGATGPQVGAVTVIGAAGEALVGAAAGAVLGAVVTPLVGLIPFRGEALGAALWMPIWLVAGVIVAIVLLAAVSAVAGLRRVLVTPLGVRTRSVQPSPSWVRVLAAVVLVGGGLLLTSSTQALGAVWGMAGIFVSVLGVFLGALVALNALGPWVLKVWARGRVNRAKTAHALVAARTVLDDPAATWRQVSGAAMAGIVAVVGGAGAAMMAGMPERMNEADRLLVTDIRTGVIVTLVLAFAGVAGTALVAQAATVLDREELSRSLSVMGMPPELSRRSRVGALMGPLILVLLVAVGISGGLLLPLVGIALLMSPTTIALVVLVCAAGVAAVWGAALLAGRLSPASESSRLLAV